MHIFLQPLHHSLPSFIAIQDSFHISDLVIKNYLHLSQSTSHNDTDLERSTLALPFTIILGDRGSGNTLPICCIARVESAGRPHLTTAMSTEAVYSQAPLVTERREIRILVLAPGTGNDILCGELIVESLDYDDLHYTALSYTWSGSIGEHFISIGGAPLYITENLSMALRRIRGPTRPRNMWIDAICINQDDHEEKAIQVNLMGHIFASATRTTVWLGDKSADSDVAMDFIGSLRQRTLDQLDDDSEIEQPCWPAVNELMQRKWWTRIWVVQEALMSRQVFVQCGEKRVDIVHFVQFVKEKESGVNYELGQSKTPSENPFMGILSDWHTHKSQAEAGGLSLQELILLTNGFQASVRNDRIFALLGLTTSGARLYVSPDYSYDVPGHLILTRLTMYFLRTSVQPLQYASLRSATDCPSWVADWTAFDTSTRLERPPTQQYEAPLLPFQTAEDYPQFEPPIKHLSRYQEPLALLVRGFVVGRVRIAVQIPQLDSITSAEGTQAKSIKTRLREWELRMIEFLELVWSGLDEAQTKGQRLKAENRVLWTKARLLSYLSDSRGGKGNIFSRDWFWNVQRQEFDFRDTPESIEFHRESISDYEAWMQCFPSSERAEQQSQDSCKLCEHSCKRVKEGMCAHCVMGQKICRTNAGRTLFITDNACNLSDPLAVQEGDVICLLLSSTSLFVMRKAEGLYWTLVGTLTPPSSRDGPEFQHLTSPLLDKTRGQLETFRLR